MIIAIVVPAALLPTLKCPQLACNCIQIITEISEMSRVTFIGLLWHSFPLSQCIKQPHYRHPSIIVARVAHQQTCGRIYGFRVCYTT